MLYCVEHLNTIAWLSQILPHLWRVRSETKAHSAIFFIDTTKIGYLCARLTQRVIGVTVERLVFRLIDVRDEDGLLIRLRIPYRDLADVQQSILRGPVVKESLAEYPNVEELRAYISKTIATDSFSDRGTLWRALFLIQICVWKSQKDQVVLFLEERPWMKEISRYGLQYGATVVSVLGALNLFRFLRNLLPEILIQSIRAFRNVYYNLIFLHTVVFNKKNNYFDTHSPRIGVEYSGHFNLNNLALYSDLFFLQQSNLFGKDITLFFSFPQDPLDEAKWSLMKQKGIEVVALYPGASKIPSVPLYVPAIKSRLFIRQRKHIQGSILEKRFFMKQVNTYNILRDYWYDLFIRTNTKLFITWYRYDERHFVMTDAMRETGGIFTIYQRALQLDPSPEIAVHADIMFGYSPFDADIERRSGSRIRYHVSVGYLHAHTFPYLKGEAKQLRANIQEHGAKYILAYFDENSHKDVRWHTGDEFMRENYLFLIEKVLACPWFGLIFKPKYPKTLRHRLGAVTPFLEKAIGTGRCFVYEKGPLHGAYPPATAALVSDLAIHGHLCAGSAGFESALAGTPTLLLDREGWGVSPLYQLGVGRVVFRNWKDIWAAIEEHRSRKGGIPKFGDWGDMLNTFDPFRDGRAAERIGTYLQWLLEGFKAGLSREEVMADAAERYVKIWGSDKITEVKG